MLSERARALLGCFLQACLESKGNQTTLWNIKMGKCLCGTTSLIKEEGSCSIYGRKEDAHQLGILISGLKSLRRGGRGGKGGAGFLIIGDSASQ